MMRIIKDVIKILFLLTGILFIKIGQGQTSLVMKGGSADGVSASTLGLCTPTSVVASGGAYDGSSLRTSIACSLPTSLVNAGGSNDGASASVLGTCTPVTVVASGGAYDGSSLRTLIACSFPSSLVNAGGGNDGVSASVLGTCTPVTVVASGGAYDGSSLRTSIACSFPTSLVNAGGSNDGLSASALGVCTRPTVVASGGAYDGSNSIALICNSSLYITSISATPANCGCIGTATVNVTGATPPYSYAWSSGASTSSVTGLCAGLYYVTITDAASAKTTGSTTIAQTGATIATTVTTTHASCTSSGSATISASGGSLPYSYNWSSGATTSAATGLTIGAYTVTLTDNGGCFVNASATITGPTPVVADMNGAGISCPPGPGNDGAANVTASGGSAPYSYLWSTGANVSSLSNLTTGTYFVTVSDVNSCTGTGSYIVLPCNHITMSLQNCTQVSPSEIRFDLYVVSDGSPTSDLKANSFQYGVNFNTGILKSGATITPSYVAGSGAFEGILPGFNFPASTMASHIRIVENAYTGSNRPSLLHNQPYRVGTFRMVCSDIFVGNSSPAFSLQDTTGPNRTPTASIVYIGNAAFTTSFQDTGSTSGKRNLAVSCSLTLNPCNVSLTPSSTYVSCNGGSDGTASATFTGGYGTNRDWQWSNGTNFTNVPTNPTTITGLTAGAYSVTITDQALCTATATATVTQPLAALGVTASSNSPVCIGTSLNLSSTVTGGTVAYSYAWTGPSGFSSTDANPAYPNATAAQQGNYFVTVTDAHSCSANTTTFVSMVACNTLLSLNLYLEGYYQGSGFMRPAMFNEAVVGSNNNQTDTIYVILHDAVVPSTVVDSTSAILLKNGTSTVTFPFAVSGQSCYIVVKHRNTLQTWSKNPVAFSPSTTYNFTTANTQAYGDNMIQVDAGPARWALYSGDMNQDQNIDLIDFPTLDLGINQGLFGYYRSDLNGDGNTDLLDFPVLDANINAGVFSRHP